MRGSTSRVIAWSGSEAARALDAPIGRWVHGVPADPWLAGGIPIGRASAADASLGWQGFAGQLGRTGIRDADGALLVGLGPRGGWIESVRAAAQAAAAATREPITVDLAARACAEYPGRDGSLVQAAATGLVLGAAGRDIELGLQLPVGLDDEAALAAVARGRAIADGVALARLWTNASGGAFTPATAADRIGELAARSGLSCLIHRGDELTRIGFGALAGIGAAADVGPAMIELRYEPPEALRTVGLVGKGITFDSGGLSLKSPAAMMGMRMDMAGAAAVCGAMQAIAALAPPVAVHAVLPFAENAIGPAGLRPGDVVTAVNGKRIQVLDTDFEGRVVMADALAWVSRGSPDAVLDIATLTYQAEVALGPEIGALICRDPVLNERVLAAADGVGEPLWPLPWAPRYLDQVRSAVADVRNHPGTDTGRALTAALFLGEFVPEQTAFGHLDMTGPAWSGTAADNGATGFGVATLCEFVSAFADSTDGEDPADRNREDSP